MTYLISILLTCLFALPTLARDPNVLTTRISIQQADMALDMFHTDFKRYPTQEEGLAVLLKSPQDVDPKVKGGNPYVRRHPEDGWGKKLLYTAPQPSKKDPGKMTRPVIWSLGADGKRGGSGADKDISSWD